MFLRVAQKQFARQLARQQVYFFSKKKPPTGFEKFDRKSNRKQTKTLKGDEELQEEYEDIQEPKIASKLEEQSPKQQIKTEQDESSKQEQEKINEQSKKENDQEQDMKDDKKKDDVRDFFEEAFKQSKNKQKEKEKEKDKEKFNLSRNKNPFKFSQYPIRVDFITLAGLGLAGVFLINYFARNRAEVESSQILDQIQNKNVVDITIIDKDQKYEIRTILKNGESLVTNVNNIDAFLFQVDYIQNNQSSKVKIKFIPRDKEGYIEYFKLSFLVILALTGIRAYYNMKQNPKDYKNFLPKDLFDTGLGLKPKAYEQRVKVTFADVAGQEEAKAEIKEFVDFLKKPKRYAQLGAKIPRGALLTGPPGTGKTLLAKACAGEAGVPFFYVSGSEFVEMFVGLGASRVRELFTAAKAKSPSIIFIDEIDAVGKKRNARGSRNEERENTLNQLLVEMDGFSTDQNVVVLAATNMKDTLDAALIRPGRFDRSIDITLPDIDGRKQIFMVHLKPIKIRPENSMDTQANRLATLTPGFSGADIANLCNEAAIIAARENSKYVEINHFEMAAERVMAGLEKKSNLSEQDRKTIAYHECGHAVVSWFLEGGDPLLKLTIIPRSKGSLGYAQYLPTESNLQTKDELLDKICCALGGRVAEEVFFGKISTGAADDLNKIFKYAQAIVTKFGMVDDLYNVSFEEDGQFEKGYSEATNQIIDQKIKQIVDECTIKTRNQIQQYKQKIEELAGLLLEKETLDLQQIAFQTQIQLQGVS
ncbi:Paraplegin [Paramecium bursaria]